MRRRPVLVRLYVILSVDGRTLVVIFAPLTLVHVMVAIYVSSGVNDWLGYLYLIAIDSSNTSDGRWDFGGPRQS